MLPTVVTFTKTINQLLPEPHASLLAGMVFGVRRTMPTSFYQALIATGTLHVIALSGQNIAILINLVAWCTLKWFSRKLSSLLTVSVIVLFILFVGAEPPVVRAGLMGGLSLIAVYFGKQYWSLLALILTSGIMVLARPDWLTSISFQLSFGASFGIILFGQYRHQKKKVQKKSNDDNTSVDLIASYSKLLSSTALDTIKQDLKLTLAAQVFTVPIILFHFHRISIISPLANVLIGWVVPFITIIGIIISIVGWIFLPLAAPLAWIAWVPLTYFIGVVNLIAKMPFASMEF